MIEHRKTAPIVIRHDLHETIRKAEEAGAFKQPTSKLVLLPHNKPKNRYQRMMDEAINNLDVDLNDHPLTVMSNLHRTLTQKLEEIHALNPRPYMPGRVKTGFSNGTPELIIGDKSHPYFRVICIEYVTPNL